MPQPIDMQRELARTTMVERMQDLAGRLSLAAQQRTQDEVDEARVSAETQATETPEAQSDDVDEDGRRKAPFVARRKKRRKGESDENAPSRIQYTANEKTTTMTDPEDHQVDVSI